ncbi:hypothetical protein [Kitasatospora herbaricolor]|uniref:Uncharacterized protein n=1 Tax=Kitasatospora herbaricolor TaxID=68217 RepID=A0ABZ1WEG9_9ACTN|nr:hypothetical protein [Kitasatospora herbaricolor]
MQVTVNADGNGTGDDGLLQRLVGEPCVDVYRFGEMGVIDFGRQVSWPLGDGGEVSTGTEFAVHAQCPFRIVQNDRIVLGYDDLFRTPPRKGSTAEEDSDRRAYDAGADALRGYLQRTSPKVESVRRRPVGDLLIGLQHGIRVEVFPTSPKREESWRFLIRTAEHVTFPPGR